MIHLLGNMIFLAAVGPLVEFAVGRLKFLAVYVIGGLVGVAGHWLLMSNSKIDQPLVGASGAIAACVGYCAVRFMRAKVPIAPHVGISVGVIALIWVVLQTLGGFVRLGDEGTGGVAYWAHLAGFLAGLVLSLVLKAPDQASLHLGHTVLDEMNERSPAAALAAAEHHLKRHPDDRRAKRAKAEALRTLHDAPAEREVWIDLLTDCPEMDEGECLQRLIECDGAASLSVPQRLRYADRVAELYPGVAESLLTSVLEEPSAEPQTPDVLLSLATLLRDRDTERSGELLNRLQTQYSLHPATELARQRGLLT